MEEVSNCRSSESGNDVYRPKICIIGAGNVASHLAVALARVANVAEIASVHKESATRLAAQVGPDCLATTQLPKLCHDADFYIIAVNDDAIENVAASTPDFPGIWAHTSGSVPIDVFKNKKTNYGVFYPLQTFSRSVEVDMGEVPFFVEGSSSSTAESLMRLASKISVNVRYADSCERGRLHIAAVFACNFTNLMWMEADNILRENGIDIKFLLPLIEATKTKLKTVTPREAMTGPARRGDTAVISQHLEMLSGDAREIYRLLSNRILNEFGQNKNV